MYDEFKHLFEKFHDKIIHVIVDDFPYKYPNIDISNGEQWTNERFQRDQIKRGLEKLDLNNEDVIIISDLDEIPNPKTLSNIKNNKTNVSINVLEMDFYYYNLNTKINRFWPSARILIFKKYNELSISCNNIRFYNCEIIKDGGWHLSYFGNSEFIKNKIENFSHQELNIDNFKNIEKINNRLNNYIDLYDRNNNPIFKIAIKDNDRLPPEYETYLQNFIVF
jgi:beta-1,4-mannosyl-glycoprotein beta-1,4-N-acetylglucosaminyltransferase